MYGVVLWSDKKDRKAVIWCEDHGDLAFYLGQDESVFGGPSLDAGDFVTFQIADDRQVRVATDPRLVADQQYLGLAESLKSKGMGLPTLPEARPLSEDNVIAFAPHRESARLAS